MTTLDVNSSSAVQWFQSLSARDQSQGGTAACDSPPASTDTAAFSTEALALNATTGATQSTDSSNSGQSSEVRQGHHHHHHSNQGQGDNGSLISQLAQDIASDLQDATGSPTATAGSSGQASTLQTDDSSAFIQQLASHVTNDLLRAYGQGSSPTNALNQVNTAA